MKQAEFSIYECTINGDCNFLGHSVSTAAQSLSSWVHGRNRHEVERSSKFRMWVTLGFDKAIPITWGGGG